MGKQNAAVAIARAATYGFAAGMGRQAARETYNKLTDPKLEPDSSKATLPLDEETGILTFDYLEKCEDGTFSYVSKQTLPLVWYDKRWKKFREGTQPDGTKTVNVNCQFSKNEVDILASKKGYTVVLKSTELVDTYTKVKTERRKKNIRTCFIWFVAITLVVLLIQTLGGTA